MTVAELIKLLGEFDQDRIVIVSSNGEGNGFSPLSEISENAYEKDSSYSGEIYPEELTPDPIEEGYTEYDIRPDAPKAIVLWPIN